MATSIFCVNLEKNIFVQINNYTFFAFLWLKVAQEYNEFTEITR